MELPSIEEIERKIDYPADKWRGNCCSVSMAIVSKGLIKGTPVYGMYHGPVADMSIFANRQAGLHRHGWIVNGDTLIDPTRWVFEDVEPYLYVSDTDDQEYDEGANVLRAIDAKPFPSEDDGEKKYDMMGGLSGQASYHVFQLTGVGQCIFSRMQIHWLATLPWQMYEGHAHEILCKIKELGKGVYVPYDNMARAEREAA